MAAASANFDLRASPLLSNISCLFVAGKLLLSPAEKLLKGLSIDLLSPLRLSLLWDLGKAVNPTLSAHWSPGWEHLFGGMEMQDNTQVSKSKRSRFGLCP